MLSRVSGSRGSVMGLGLLLLLVCGGGVMGDFPLDIITSPGVPSSPSITQVSLVAGSGSGSLVVVFRSPRLPGVSSVLYDDGGVGYLLSVNGVLVSSGCVVIQPLNDNQTVITQNDITTGNINKGYRGITLQGNCLTQTKTSQTTTTTDNGNAQGQQGQQGQVAITLVAHNTIGSSQATYWGGVPQAISPLQATINGFTGDVSVPSSSSISSSSSSSVSLAIGIAVPVVLLVGIGVGALGIVFCKKHQTRHHTKSLHQAAPTTGWTDNPAYAISISTRAGVGPDSPQLHPGSVSVSESSTSLDNIKH